MILGFKLFESSLLLKKKTIDVKSWDEIISAIPYIDNDVKEILEDVIDNRVTVSIEKKVFVGDRIAADKGALKSELISEFVDYINWGYVIKINITDIKNNNNPRHSGRGYVNSHMQRIVNIKEYFEFHRDLFNALSRFERYFDVMMSDTGNFLTIQLKNEDSPVEINKILTEPVRSHKDTILDKIDKYLVNIANIQRSGTSLVISPKTDKYPVEKLLEIINKINRLRIINPIIEDGKIIINS